MLKEIQIALEELFEWLGETNSYERVQYVPVRSQYTPDRTEYRQTADVRIRHHHY